MDNVKITRKCCAEISRNSGREISVFDLMYETGLAYADLQAAVTALTESGEVEQIDGKTIKFTGDLKKTSQNEPSADDTDAGIKHKAEYENIAWDKPLFNFPADSVPDKDYVDFVTALRYCIESNSASVFMLQRRFPIGYIEACKIIDWMENLHYITPADGGARKVIMTREQFDDLYGDVECEEDFTDEIYDSEEGDDDNEESDDFDLDSIFADEDEDDEFCILQLVARWTVAPFKYNADHESAKKVFLFERVQDVVSVDKKLTRQDAIELVKILRKINQIEENDEMFGLILDEFTDMSDDEYDALHSSIFAD